MFILRQNFVTWLKKSHYVTCLASPCSFAIAEGFISRTSCKIWGETDVSLPLSFIFKKPASKNENIIPTCIIFSFLLSHDSNVSSSFLESHVLSVLVLLLSLVFFKILLKSPVNTLSPPMASLCWPLAILSVLIKSLTSFPLTTHASLSTCTAIYNKIMT